MRRFAIGFADGFPGETGKFEQERSVTQEKESKPELGGELIRRLTAAVDAVLHKFLGRPLCPQCPPGRC